MKHWVLIVSLVIGWTAFAAVVPTLPSQELKLVRGWNLVTLERPIEADSVAKLLKLCPFRLDPATQALVRCKTAADFQPGSGIWLFSQKEQYLVLVSDATQTTWNTPSLVPGWNLIGFLETSSWKDSATAIYQWIDGSFQEVDKAKLTVGTAYFVKK